jgi:hypothetical protein
MENILHEALNLHSDLKESGTIKDPDDYAGINNSIYSLIISLYQWSQTTDEHIRTGHLYVSLIHLDRVEFELKALDFPEGWKDLDIIFREICVLRQSIYSLVLNN